MFLKICMAIALICTVGSAQGKIYTLCELKTLFENNNMPGSVEDWVCLVDKESGGNTAAAAAKANSNGSRDYGLFQINSKYWCSGEATISNECSTACSNFADENVADDIACAKKIYQRHGFNAWCGWRDGCKNKI